MRKVSHVALTRRVQSSQSRPFCNAVHHLPSVRAFMWKTDVKDLLDSTDVQDPTDFPPSSTAPGLRALDSALRCNICQELYEAPVVLTCGHCFCSLVRVTITISRLHLITGAPFLQCARSQISVKPACPSCWKETAISSFRINPAMEEAVTAWKDARHVTRHCAITMDRSSDA